jgi:hypothetical protein
MKKTLIKATIITSISVMSSHALFGGIGFHYAPDLFGGVKGSSNQTYQFEQKESYGMQGVGAKIWVDILPIVDVEATVNMQFNKYDVTVAGQKLETETGMPGFSKAQPMFAKVAADLTVTYPFLSIPKIVKFYAGGGVSKIWSPKVLNDAFFIDAVNSSNLSNTTENNIKAASDQFKDDSFNTGIGGHVILGARTQLPIIPLDFYLNGKYHFGGAIDKAARHGVTIEIGGGLSI